MIDACLALTAVCTFPGSSTCQLVVAPLVLSHSRTNGLGVHPKSGEGCSQAVFTKGFVGTAMDHPLHSAPHVSTNNVFICILFHALQSGVAARCHETSWLELTAECDEPQCRKDKNYAIRQQDGSLCAQAQPEKKCTEDVYCSCSNMQLKKPFLVCYWGDAIRLHQCPHTVFNKLSVVVAFTGPWQC